MNINTKKILLLVCVIPVFVYFGNILIEEYLSDLLELEGGGYLMKEALVGCYNVYTSRSVICAKFYCTLYAAEEYTNLYR